MRHVTFRAPSAAITLVLVTAPQSAAAQRSGPQKAAAAQALFEQATAALDRHDYATACPKLEEVVSLVPEGIGARLTLGECYEGDQRLASAWTMYTQAEAAAIQANHTARRREARAAAERLRPRLAKITIVVPDALRALSGLVVTRDGVPVGAAQWGVPVPVDPGRHLIAATSGERRWETSVTITAEAATASVTIEAPAPPAAKAPPATSTLTRAVNPPATSMVIADNGSRDRASPSGLSHRWQPGAVARLDIDPLNPGVRTAVGLTFGLFDSFELGVSALVGSTTGVEPQVTAYLLKGAWKPLLNVGAPIFFSDGAHAGVRGAAGLQWDPSRHFGVFAQVGGAFFPSAPAGFASGVLLPSAGVQGRL